MRTVFAVMLLISASHLAAQENLAPKRQILDYSTAYNRCQSGDKPMLVLVTATWCAPCQQMKNTTLPELLNKDSLKDVHFATVDYDSELAVAQQLIGDRGVPQLVLFQKVDNQWVRRYISGMQTTQAVEDFINKSKAGVVQVANSAAEAKK